MVAARRLRFEIADPINAVQRVRVNRRRCAEFGRLGRIHNPVVEWEGGRDAPDLTRPATAVDVFHFLTDPRPRNSVALGRRAEGGCYPRRVLAETLLREREAGGSEQRTMREKRHVYLIGSERRRDGSARRCRGAKPLYQACVS